MKRIPAFIAVIAGLLTLTVPSFAAPFVLSCVASNSNSSFFVTIADLNGDGKPDLISAANGTFSMTIATNAGNGIFFSNATYLGVGGFAAAVADFNGDGKPDLIGLTYSNGINWVTILTNAGGGVFVSNATYFIADSAFFVTVADLNGDGKPDIITANNSSLTVLTNAGGTFPVARSYTVVQSDNSQNVAVADLNGDGRPDLIAPDFFGNLFEVFTNAGGGILVSNAVYGPLGSPGWVVAADFNNDGKIDVACGNYDSTVAVYTNAGNGVLVRSQTIMAPGYTSGNAYNIAAVDVDGDGYVDLLFEQKVSGIPVLTTCFNSGSGGIFSTNYIYSTNGVNTPFGGGTWFAAGDLNGDGKPDLVSVGYAGFTVFTNNISTNVLNKIGFTTPANITVEATGPAGAVVSFSAPTNWVGVVPVTNVPPSGSTFPLGTNTVTSSAGYRIDGVLQAYSNTTFTVTVRDTTPPVITVLGANPATNFVDNYIDPGATATDIVSGNLTAAIQVSGNLNTNVPGTYTVNYSVTDGAGNTAFASRTVVIQPIPPLGIGNAPGNQTALFWPITDHTNYVLQTTTNLASGNWVTVTNGVPVFAVEVTNTGPAAFYRLKPQ